MQKISTITQPMLTDHSQPMTKSPNPYLPPWNIISQGNNTPAYFGAKNFSENSSPYTTVPIMLARLNIAETPCHFPNLLFKLFICSPTRISWVSFSPPLCKPSVTFGSFLPSELRPSIVSCLLRNSLIFATRGPMKKRLIAPAVSGVRRE